MARDRGRGRVVMLVDNFITGDSRVQKQAASMAAAGWDVVLVGRSRDSKLRRSTIGEARVLQVPMALPLKRRRHEYRRAPLRSPLAYPAGPLTDYRLQRTRAAVVDLQSRIDLAGPSASPAARARRSALGARLAGARVRQRWVELRADRTRALLEARRAMTSPLDRLTTAFWTQTMGDRAWRRLDPSLWDWEVAYGPQVDRLKPDIIHANDFRMLGVAIRGARRLRAQGRKVSVVWDAHEFLPGIKPWHDHPRWHVAQIANEKEYGRHADVVTTVSESLASLLVEQHGLTERPRVVLNAPTASDGLDRDVVGLRDDLGLDEDTPLMVYSGLAAPQRGLMLMVEALPELPGVHAAFVVPAPDNAFVQSLLERARELGVDGRVHTRPYVAYDEVVPYLRSADLGVIPIDHWPNHEIALITKFFEYSHARLPLVVSDVEAMGDLTRETGQGEVFTAGDAGALADAVRAVLDDPKRYRAAYDEPGRLDSWTWEAQAVVLDEVYASVLPRARKAR
ncbi:MAG: glycosyltransferase family 4 protein [Nocardioidaceae bacterium]|nr:glycosyltransferase family 4 protein [Nocardioidaceae bacterium]